MIGSVVGNYRVVERIGDGGMGTVYRALDQMLDREVALKVMRPELSRQPGLAERFRQEAIALARLNHPNIAGVYGLEKSGDDMVMVMEFVRGETLESIVQRSGQIAWARAFELCTKVLDALDHAHDKGVVHRDIKPANIMLDRAGVVKVMDFGIARIMGKSRQTRMGAAVGTPMYMSPEQLKGEEVDGRSDLYSLGAVLYELITGKLAFEADSDYELMMKQLNEAPPHVRASLPDVPDQVDLVLQRAMAKRKEDRFANGQEMRRALVAAAAGDTGVLRRPAPATRLAEAASAPVEGSLQVTADQPATRVAAPETRLASAPTPTPAQQPWAPSASETRVAESFGPTLARRVSDWRLVAAGAALVLAIGGALRYARSPNVPPGPDSAVAVAPPETTNAAPPRDTSVSVVEPPPTRVTVDTTAHTVAPPPTTEVATPVSLPDPSKVPAAKGPLPKKPNDTRAPLVPTPSTVAPPREDPKPQPPETRTPPTEPKPEPKPEPETRTESRAEVESAVATALREIANAVGAGDAGRLGAVLKGNAETESAFISLMREGRLSMSISGAPDVDVAGGRATARFEAVVNVRSAFGGNKRRSAPFVAELSRNGDRWHVVSLRPSGKLDLK